MEDISRMIREGFRFEEHVAFEEKLAKLERNETQMDGKQRERYARALEKLRTEICENAFQHFQDIGVKCYTDVQMPGRRLAITYFFPLPSFRIVREHVDMLLEFRADPDNTEVI